MTNNKVKIIGKHRKGCFAVGRVTKGVWDSPWSGLVIQYWGNFAGNPNGKHHRHHLWASISCKDPECSAKKIIHSEVLNNL
jgi:hypothetical protein